METDYKHAYAGNMQYVARADGKPWGTLWIVTTQNPNSTPLGVKRVAAYFSEALARAHAAQLVRAGVLIGLENIDVLDLPPNERKHRRGEDRRRLAHYSKQGGEDVHYLQCSDGCSA
jgi:hypothetical protein